MTIASDDTSIVLGENNYGKAEVRLMRVDRGDRHTITDLNVSIALSGEFAATHLSGRNDDLLTTDTQKNTVYAFARDGIGTIEDFGLRLARHFVESQRPVRHARVRLTQYSWARLTTDGKPASHSFVRAAEGTRTAEVTYGGADVAVCGGITDMTVLNSTGSEFTGFARDRYTTLAEARDRILATAITATWRYARLDGIDWTAAHVLARTALLEAFADTYSRSLQQTLYAMGARVLRQVPDITDITLSLPNKHHILVDLIPFELDNPGEVFSVSERPYGLIEGTVRRKPRRIRHCPSHMPTPAGHFDDL